MPITWTTTLWDYIGKNLSWIYSFLVFSLVVVACHGIAGLPKFCQLYANILLVFLLLHIWVRGWLVEYLQARRYQITSAVWEKNFLFIQVISCIFIARDMREIFFLTKHNSFCHFMLFMTTMSLFEGIRRSHRLFSYQRYWKCLFCFLCYGSFQLLSSKIYQ
jgi:hypothetical protein